MIRQYFSALEKTGSKQNADKIKWRCHEVLRIEAFSDAVFAFALSLLIISLEVPHTAKELFEMMKGFYPFIICFGFLFIIWHTQYKFFRQYGLHDNGTLMLNAALMFLVLFYVYPLKFVTNVIAGLGHGAYHIDQDDFLPLMLLYNAGFAGIYTLFGLMYWNALRQREHLELTPAEVYVTKTHLYMNVYMGAVGWLAVAIVKFGGKYAGLGMASYGLLGGIGLLSAVRDKRFKRIFGTPSEEQSDRDPE